MDILGVRGGLGCLVLGNAITTLDFYYLDLLLAIPLVAIIFTAFSSAGVANAINMIDGLNGLALLKINNLVNKWALRHQTEE